MKAILCTLLALAQCHEQQQSIPLKTQLHGVLVGLSVDKAKQVFATHKDENGSHFSEIQTGSPYNALDYAGEDIQLVREDRYYARIGSSIYRFAKGSYGWQYKELAQQWDAGELTDYRVHKGRVYATVVFKTIPNTDEDSFEPAEYKTNLYKRTAGAFVLRQSIGGYVHSFAIDNEGEAWYAIRDKRPGQEPEARFLTKALLVEEGDLENGEIPPSFSQLAIDKMNHLFLANETTVQHYDSDLDLQEIILSSHHNITRLAIVPHEETNELYMGGSCKQGICFSSFRYLHFDKYAR